MFEGRIGFTAIQQIAEPTVEKALAPDGQQAEHGQAVCPGSKHGQQHPGHDQKSKQMDWLSFSTQLTRLILNNKSSFGVTPVYKKDINDHDQIQQRATMMAGAGALGEETVC